MIEITDKKKCCGCWACSNVCPRKCINMEVDEEGFRYPKINRELCIDCGLCEKVCPVLHSDSEDIPHEQQGWLVQHKNDTIRHESTSGGAFTAIATWVIRQGGIVFGAGYRNGTFVVAHQAVEDEDELKLFRNSKYVQSEIGDCYNQVLKFLKESRLVLFSGTPCQIEGLLGFLRGREYQNLILQDIVCHGIPSPAIFNSYIALQQQNIGGRFTNVLFRDKHYGYHYSSFSIYNEDETKNYHKGIDTNAFLRAYFSNLSDRPSCYDCPFKKRYRKSDLTLWDCFPIEKFTKDLDGKGTTRVLVQSDKGMAVMKAVMGDLRAIPVDADKLTSGVNEMYYSVPMNPKREQFFREFNYMSKEEFFLKWFPITFKTKLNSFIRITAHKLGIYTITKRLFLLFYTKRDVRTRNKINRSQKR
ncbi:MAG: Coenzyme F420 hydrogenase/dehydrogenase, beta subunit C-terminal domain [Bacteroidales bacterium]|nr:Coenzyme F420 hydrogenase/dehydrogenase, beta subunit C-terminal domain [Bacteroidales bacterium]